MPPYDTTQFEPPARLAHVTLRNVDTGLTSPDVPMLLDTGADVTLIPRDTLNELNIPTVQDKLYQLTSFDGSISFAPVAKLELIFCRRTFRGQFLIIDEGLGILGRNVLNSVPLVFDGPNLTWDEERPSQPSDSNPSSI